MTSESSSLAFTITTYMPQGIMTLCQTDVSPSRFVELQDVVKLNWELPQDI